MYSIKLNWKEFNVDLNLVESWFRANAGEAYSGNSADSVLTLWFTAEPVQETQDAINSYWDSITAESEEATSYLPQAEITAAIEAAKTALLSKSWDEMSLPERKLVLGQIPTREELGL